MSAQYDIELNNSHIVLQPGQGILASMDDEKHGKLLTYLLDRVKTDRTNRMQRIRRFAEIDKAVSTWIKLDDKEKADLINESLTGRSKMLPVALPILVTHLEDSVAFFAEIFAPQAKNFYQAAGVKQQPSAQALADAMNKDSKRRKYYKNVASMIRSMIKYNVGGGLIRWEAGKGVGESFEAGNRTEALDMYNAFWDTSIADPAQVATDAEWFASAKTKNRMFLVRGMQRKIFARVDKVLITCDEKRKAKRAAGGNAVASNDAKFYKFPPVEAGLGNDFSQTTSATVAWDSFGLGWDSDKAQDIPGHEIIEMFCRLNPGEHGLNEEDKDSADPYTLWRFLIADGSQVIFAEEMLPRSDNEAYVDIPVYMAHMIQDDTLGAQRSQMELMRPFQRFQSFLMNLYVAAARKNVWGIKAIDPNMFDTAELEQGDVAAVLKSKQPGRDVNTGITTLDSKTGVEGVFEVSNQIEAMMNRLFPAQALPGQVAGLDRAVKNQVTALLQGVARRMHMTAKLLDSDLFLPMRTEAYRNLASQGQGDAQAFSGLTEEDVAVVLGSGLHQINAEIIQQQMMELVITLIQNPQAAAQFDMPSLIGYMSTLWNMPTDLGPFVKQVNPAVEGPEQPLPGAPIPAAPMQGAPMA